MLYDSVDSDQAIHVYADSNSNQLVDGGRATTGIIVMYNRVPILWSSMRQTIVTDEPCEAELFGFNMALKKSLFVRNLLVELGIIIEDEQKVIHMYVDNKSSKRIADQSVKRKSKHYPVALLFVNDFIERKELKLHKINSDQNVADLNTKFVTNPLFYRYIDLLNFEFIPE